MAVTSGLVGAFLFFTTKLGKSKNSFNLGFQDIKSISHGKIFFTLDALEIIDTKGSTFRIRVAKYQDWEDELRKVAGAAPMFNLNNTTIEAI